MISAGDHLGILVEFSDLAGRCSTMWCEGALLVSTTWCEGAPVVSGEDHLGILVELSDLAGWYS